MIKWIQVVFGLLMLLPLYGRADTVARQALQQKLHGLKQFTSHFSQTVSDMEGELLYTAEGELSVKRPDRFRWHTQQPDEELVVADGAALWVYNPFVEQVTVLDQQQAVDQSPLLLLTGDDPDNWSGYQVSREDNTFEVTSLDQDSNIARFTLSFDAKGQLLRFSVSERQGQSSEFLLSRFDSRARLDDAQFRFTVPDGVTVDDQR